MRPRERLRGVYAAFNARDIDSVLAVMHPEVVWPNSMEGGTVRGHEGIRAYWTRQWAEIDPRVDPLSFQLEADGRIAVLVQQLVKDLEGRVLAKRKVEHVFAFENGLIRSMEIRELPSP